ncbi:MAG: hypothetical protein KC589_04355, partial [Nanoarchaeota archaeon]|nr:hypothetical protein [Nanoarchaeota archaeon]
DLEIEFATGATNWKSVGLVNITGKGLYTINITDTTILNSWESITNRDLRIKGVNFDYYSSSQIDIIAYNLSIIDVNYQTYTSKWSSIFSNTVICGQYNLTNLYSTDRQNATNHSIYTGINFSIPCNPIITLISPINGTKLITNGDVNLTWHILSPDTTLSCDLYINSIFNQTISCNSSINNSLNINLGRGYYNWTINATDTNNLSSIAPEESFWNILDRHSSIIKSISSLNTDLYGIEINIENKLNVSQDIVPIDFVNNRFNYGSFSIMYDWLNLTSGIFNGTILGWDLTTTPLSINQINYSVTKNTNEYHLLDEFMVGLD